MKAIGARARTFLLVSIAVLAAPTSAKKAPAYKTPEHFSALAFQVWTGDDDLRSHSEAWVDLTFPNGTQKRCWLKKFDEQGWDNNTEHDGRQCILPAPRTFSQLRATKFKFSYAGQGAEFQTWDNWNVDRVRVAAQDFHRHHFPCLIDASGNPLVRMTLHLGSLRLDQLPSTC